MLSYYLFTFKSSNMAMKAEMAVEGISGVRLIPLIPEISAGCGLALKSNKDKFEQVNDTLKSKLIEVDGIYLVDRDVIKI